MHAVSNPTRMREQLEKWSGVAGTKLQGYAGYPRESEKSIFRSASAASLNVKRLRLAVIAIARLTPANMAADSGVLLGIILLRSSFAISYLPRVAVARGFRRTNAAPRFAEYSHKN